MFFGTYIFAEKHIFFVRPLLEHDVYEKVPCKKVRPLLEHDVYAQGELKPGFRSNASICSQTSPRVALVQ